MMPRRRTVIEGVEAIAIGFGWLALASFLSCGGVWAVMTLDSRSYDQPISPDEIQALVVESLFVALVCAAIMWACAVLRRRAFARSRIVTRVESSA